jgi:hypothetical protein
MPKFLNSLRAWNSESFFQTLKNELEQLESGVLPLDNAVSQGGYVDDSHITATVLRTNADEQVIHARAGIFFTEIVINCGCGDDPMETNAYCVMQIRIDKTTGQTEFEVIQD